MSLQSYFMLNAAIAISYLLSRWVLNLLYSKIHISQFERLKHARFCLIVTMGSFLLMPVFLTFLPSEYHSHFKLEPLLKSASPAFYT